MSVTIAEARRPYVVFERELVEDREASKANGHYTEKPRDIAYVTPMGSKDRYPFEVSKWFKRLQKEVENGRFPAAWLQQFKDAYRAFEEGSEAPVEGTALKSWPSISKGQMAACLAINIRTVEDLATANEEAINRLGMGGRALKQSAIAWLEASNGPGKLAAELALLRQKVETLEAKNAELVNTNRQLATATVAVGQPQAAASDDNISLSDIMPDDEPPAKPTVKPLK